MLMLPSLFPLNGQCLGHASLQAFAHEYSLSLGICCKMFSDFEPTLVNDLAMVLADPKDSGAWWLVNLIKSRCELYKSAELKVVLEKEPRLIICPDAKNTLIELQIKPKANLRWLCLNTIKKLLSKAFSKVAIPEWKNQGEMVFWALESTKTAFLMIHNAHLETLCSLECQVIPATIAMEQAGLPFHQEAWQIALEQFDKECEDTKTR
ncbi:MAG TPA: hypothetical protein VEK06_04805, partial [Myxococcota bacterium]|nr:hypothetical protein [Myxococcota bacterium]